MSGHLSSPQFIVKIEDGFAVADFKSDIGHVRICLPLGLSGGGSPDRMPLERMVSMKSRIFRRGPILSGVNRSPYSDKNWINGERERNRIVAASRL